MKKNSNLTIKGIRKVTEKANKLLEMSNEDFRDYLEKENK